MSVYVNGKKLPPYVKHSETSKEAAYSMVDAAETLKEQVYVFMKGCGFKGATDDEVQLGLGLKPDTQRPRRRELMQEGRCRSSSRKRLAVSGKRQAVWVAI